MNNLLDAVKELVRKYAANYLKLARITVLEKTASLLSFILFALIGIFLFFCILMFAGFGLAELFVEMGWGRMESVFAVTGIYLLLLVLLVLLRKPVTRMFAGSVVRALTDDESEKD